MRFCTIFLIAVVTVAFAATVDNQPAFGPNRSFRLESSHDSFGERSHGITEMVDGRVVFYPLPQSSFADYRKLRPDDLALNPRTEKDYERQEFIGPHQIEGDKLWFGKSFYDSEGMAGVGAFGYFDTATRQYQLFSPPEVAPWEISAILVEKDAVWLGLDRFHEDISTLPGGLLRWDRATGKMHNYPLEFAVGSIEPRGNLLHLDALRGYAEFVPGTGQVRRFEVRRLKSGSSAVVPVVKFPPPPTHN